MNACSSCGARSVICLFVLALAVTCLAGVTCVSCFPACYRVRKLARTLARTLTRALARTRALSLRLALTARVLSL